MEIQDSKEDEPKQAPDGKAGLALRRDLLGVLYASGVFLLFLLAADFLPVVVYLGCIGFLLVGLWVGWRSCRPWVDGIFYGGFSTLVAAVLIVLISDMGWLGCLAALFLALPQGVIGVWLGARLFHHPV